MVSLMTAEGYLAEARTKFFTGRDPYSNLSQADLAVFHLLGQGHSHASAARSLGVSPSTIGRRSSSILRRLDLSDHAALVRAYTESKHSIEQSGARVLAEKVLPSLAGGKILCPVLRDDDWCGLIVLLPTGRTITVWLLSDPDGDRSGWVLIE